MDGLFTWRPEDESKLGQKSHEENICSADRQSEEAKKSKTWSNCEERGDLSFGVTGRRNGLRVRRQGASLDGCRKKRYPRCGCVADPVWPSKKRKPSSHMSLRGRLCWHQCKEERGRQSKSYVRVMTNTTPSMGSRIR